MFAMFSQSEIITGWLVENKMLFDYLEFCKRKIYTLFFLHKKPSKRASTRSRVQEVSYSEVALTITKSFLRVS